MRDVASFTMMSVRVLFGCLGIFDDFDNTEAEGLILGLIELRDEGGESGENCWSNGAGRCEFKEEKGEGERVRERERECRSEI